MQIPLQIVFRGFPHSDAVEANVRKKAVKLEKFYPRIIGCRVVVEAKHHHHHQGYLYHVRIDLTVPQKELVISRERHNEHGHEDLYVTIRDAFHSARRRLEDYARIQRSDIKSHEVPLHGKVITLVPDLDYGLIQTPDGGEIIFHRNSVMGKGFDVLEIGSGVRFAKTTRDEEPRATTVHIIGKHHLE
ncbi:MAG: HPF/RaiA family ribosome-associated protein [Pseudomonadota bacterium]